VTSGKAIHQQPTAETLRVIININLVLFYKHRCYNKYYDISKVVFNYLDIGYLWNNKINWYMLCKYMHKPI